MYKLAGLENVNERLRKTILFNFYLIYCADAQFHEDDKF